VYNAALFARHRKPLAESGPGNRYPDSIRQAQPNS
jgi:hypothetical protein